MENRRKPRRIGLIMDTSNRHLLKLGTTVELFNVIQVLFNLIICFLLILPRRFFPDLYKSKPQVTAIDK